MLARCSLLSEPPVSTVLGRNVAREAATLLQMLPEVTTELKGERLAGKGKPVSGRLARLYTKALIGRTRHAATQGDGLEATSGILRAT